MIEVARRHDGLWNVWCVHNHEAASRWQVIHVAKSRFKAWQWVKGQRT